MNQVPILSLVLLFPFLIKVRPELPSSFEGAHPLTDWHVRLSESEVILSSIIFHEGSRSLLLRGTEVLTPPGQVAPKAVSYVFITPHTNVTDVIYYIRTDQQTQGIYQLGAVQFLNENGDLLAQIHFSPSDLSVQIINSRNESEIIDYFSLGTWNQIHLRLDFSQSLYSIFVNGLRSTEMPFLSSSEHLAQFCLVNRVMILGPADDRVEVYFDSFSFSFQFDGDFESEDPLAAWENRLLPSEVVANISRDRGYLSSSSLFIGGGLLSESTFYDALVYRFPTPKSIQTGSHLWRLSYYVLLNSDQKFGSIYSPFFGVVELINTGLESDPGDSAFAHVDMFNDHFYVTDKSNSDNPRRPLGPYELNVWYHVIIDINLLAQTFFVTFGGLSENVAYPFELQTTGWAGFRLYNIFSTGFDDGTFWDRFKFYDLMEPEPTFPSAVPTISDDTGPPSQTPTQVPSMMPTSTPTTPPAPPSTLPPTRIPTSDPTSLPTSDPTSLPTSDPTSLPTAVPSISPITSTPTLPSTLPPTPVPTRTKGPSATPTTTPTISPTLPPTYTPTLACPAVFDGDFESECPLNAWDDTLHSSKSIASIDAAYGYRSTSSLFISGASGDFQDALTHYFVPILSQGLWRISYAVSTNTSNSGLAFSGVTQFLASDCTAWGEKLVKTFLLGYACGNGKRYQSLEEAKVACCDCDECVGVTLERDDTSYTIREGQQGPSIFGESSWKRGTFSDTPVIFVHFDMFANRIAVLGGDGRQDVATYTDGVWFLIDFGFDFGRQIFTVRVDNGPTFTKPFLVEAYDIFAIRLTNLLLVKPDEGTHWDQIYIRQVSVLTPAPTHVPSTAPSLTPTRAPSPFFTNIPTPAQTSKPSPDTTQPPSPHHSMLPTSSPSPLTTEPPSPITTSAPTPSFTPLPTPLPTTNTTPEVTSQPTPELTSVPTGIPSAVPTSIPTPSPTQDCGDCLLEHDSPGCSNSNVEKCVCEDLFDGFLAYCCSLIWDFECARATQFKCRCSETYYTPMPSPLPTPLPSPILTQQPTPETTLQPIPVPTPLTTHAPTPHPVPVPRLNCGDCVYVHDSPNCDLTYINDCVCRAVLEGYFVSCCDTGWNLACVNIAIQECNCEAPPNTPIPTVSPTPLPTVLPSHVPTPKHTLPPIPTPTSQPTISTPVPTQILVPFPTFLPTFHPTIAYATPTPRQIVGSPPPFPDNLPSGLVDLLLELPCVLDVDKPLETTLHDYASISDVIGMSEFKQTLREDFSRLLEVDLSRITLTIKKNVEIGDSTNDVLVSLTIFESPDPSRGSSVQRIIEDIDKQLKADQFGLSRLHYGSITRCLSSYIEIDYRSSSMHQKNFLWSHWTQCVSILLLTYIIIL